MFDSLTEKLEGVFRTLRGQGSLSADDVDKALREIRLALLEADVHFKVVRDFLARVRERATGQDVLKSLTPAQAVLRVVRDELVTLLGGDGARLNLSNKVPSVILMAGLQGSGKTTSSAKLARFLAKQGRHPLLVSTDVYRPAAREQLSILASQNGLVVHHPADLTDPVAILRSALAEARASGRDVLLVDTAGRLHVDDELMKELETLREIAQPSEVLFVADAMTGQDAVRSAEEFHRRIGITGVILTKVDGDARGGAALSVAAVTGCPVKFAGVGERADQFEPFDAGRMASRILGMGDVLGLIEKVEQAVDLEQAEALARKIRRSEFSLADYRDQLKQVRKMGPLDQVLGMLPGLGAAAREVDVEAGEREMRRAVAIIDSMTTAERCNHSLVNGSRRKRIARGSGTSVEDVNRLLKQFVQTRRMMKALGGGGGKMMKRLAGRLPQFR